MSTDTNSPAFRRRAHPAPPLTAHARETASDGKGGYDIGYGKPPTQHRFKPGKSGNPKGRPKGARGIDAMVREMLGKKTEINVGGKRRKIPFIQALLLKQLEMAGKGDLRALGELVKFYRAAVPDQGAKPATSPHAEEPNDEAILAAYREIILAEAIADADGKTGKEL